MLEGFPGEALQRIGGEIPVGTNPISRPFPLKLPSNLALLLSRSGLVARGSTGAAAVTS